MPQVPKANYDRVIAKKIDQDIDQLHGMIVKSDGGKERPFFGEIIAVGEGDYSLGVLIPMKAKVGDKIVFPQIGPTKFRIDQEEFISLREREIIAFIVEE